MPAKVLVVSVSDTDILIIQEVLKNKYDLIICDACEATRLLSVHHDINMIILDADENDKEVIKRLALSCLDLHKKIHIIILTGLAEYEEYIKGLNISKCDYLKKPVSSKLFKSRINRHLRYIKQESLESKLLKQNKVLDAIFNQAPIGIAITYFDDSSTLDSEHFIVNPMYEKITGRSKEELLKLGWAGITHPDDLEEDTRNYNRLKSGEISSYSLEKRYIRPDGSIVWIYMIAAPLIIDMYKFSYICLIQDITENKKIEKDLAESVRSKSVLLSHLPGLAYRCYYDREWTMQFVSEGCYELTGYKPESLLYNKELSYNDIISPEYRETLWEEWNRILAARRPFKYEYEIQTASGGRKWVLEMGQGIYNENGEVEALEGLVLDISERKEMENNLIYSNEHDRWTGLYNRGYLENLLKNDAKRLTEIKRAVISINLSAIQALTTIYGFHYSQDLMKKVADTLNLFCNDNRLLFNTYENRFVFYIKDYRDKYELIEFCRTVAGVLQPLLTVERISSGIGVIEINRENEQDIDKLLKNLLIASERAMEMDGEDFSYCFFDEDMEAQIMREEEIKQELSVIETDPENSGLFLHYQPVVDAGTGRICGYEALARLNSKKLGLVSPREFIPIAEKTKLIVALGKEVMLQAFRFLSRIRAYGYEGIVVSVNVSAIQLLRFDFNRNLFDMINQIGVNPSDIAIEITESVFASNYQEINRTLGELKAAGIRIAIDDFGIGYSSLARERELNINCLKIDKYFIDKLIWLKPEEAITGDIISMAHKLDHIVIAEGIEHEVQREYLIKHGCDKLQGFLISKPVDEDAAIDLLRKSLPA